ncbi:MAG: YtxH domain-containing protein [Gemmatimonadota bacterium]
MADGSRTFGALLIGAVMGAVIAILLAPDKGEKTRKRLAKKRDEWGERASDVLESAGDAMEKGRKRFGI